MSTRSLSRIPIFAAQPSPVGPGERRGHCKISEDLATELGMRQDLAAGETVHLRIEVTARDVNTLYNPGCADFLGRAATFVVDEIIAGSERVEIHPNSRPGAKDGGVFELFGQVGNPFAGVSIPANARVTLSRPAPPCPYRIGSEPTIHSKARCP